MVLSITSRGSARWWSLVFKRGIHTGVGCPVCRNQKTADEGWSWDDFDLTHMELDMVPERCGIYPELGQFNFRRQLWVYPDGSFGEPGVFPTPQCAYVWDEEDSW